MNFDLLLAMGNHHVFPRFLKKKSPNPDLLGFCGLPGSPPHKIRAESSSNGCAGLLPHSVPAIWKFTPSGSQHSSTRKVDEFAVQNFLMDVLCIVTGSHVFWDFGSLCQRRCGVFCADCCGSGNPCACWCGSSNRRLRRRCGVPCASCRGIGSRHHSVIAHQNWLFTSTWKGCGPLLLIPLSGLPRPLARVVFRFRAYSWCTDGGRPTA